MAHPEWVLKHKIPNADIKCIRGRYYLYNRTAVWCPEKGRTKKVSLKQIGVIDQEYGLIPTGMSKVGKVRKGESKIKSDMDPNTDFLDKFETIEDPRAERNKLYSMGEVLLVALLGVICGAEGWQDLENYGKSKITYLRQFFEFKNGIPSDDTFRRFFRSIDPEHFKKIFHEWVRSLARTVGAAVIAIDGKCSRRSHDGDGKMLHMVSAFATEARLVLGQEKVSDKSNEITAIPKLLDLLDIDGHIITIDAMGCQYAIADKIIQKNADYVFALKGNQSSLQDDVELYFNNLSHGDKIKSHTEYDKGHGRIETRTCSISNNVKWLTDMHPNWASIKSIIRIDAKRELKDSVTQETRYYISSLDVPPQQALKAVRDHWGIENCLHWILDMSFNEDYSRIRKGNAPQVMAIMRHFALNMLQRYKQNAESNKHKRQSIKGLRKICAWDEQALDELLSQDISW